jgi:antitoxin component YwqK of YwqJK toxin-antitoxin module
MSGPVKTIDVNIGYDIIIPITVNENNGFLFTLATDTARYDEPININDLLPKLVDTSALSLYIYFLRGMPPSQQPSSQQPSSQQPSLQQPTQSPSQQINTDDVLVVDRQTMIDCLQIYDLMGDGNFFQFLLKSLFKLWTVLSPVLYSNKVSEEVKWEIWLQCPYQLLPDMWQQNDAFMRLWHKNVNNKIVIINGDEVFTFEHVSERIIMDEVNIANGEDEDEHLVDVPTTVREKVTSYIRQHDNVNISDKKITDIREGKIIDTEYYTTYNGKEQGKVITELGTDVTTSNKINGVDNGPENNRKGEILRWKDYKINGDMEGLKTYYYDNGRVSRKTMYKKGQFNGLDILYLNTAQPERQIAIEWVDGRKLKQTSYSKDGYVEADHVINGQVYIVPVAYRFYTPDGILTRTITYPLSRAETKLDTFYDDEGHQINTISYGKNQTFDIRFNKWRH